MALAYKKDNQVRKEMDDHRTMAATAESEGT
jgi:hypothetical protein